MLLLTPPSTYLSVGQCFLSTTLVLEFSHPVSHYYPLMPDDANFASFQNELGKLVEIFTRNLAHYKSSHYDEASIRNEFLNPLFRYLGWDVENKAGHIPKHREVEIESRTQIGGRQKRADYLSSAPIRSTVLSAKRKSRRKNSTPVPPSKPSATHGTKISRSLC